MHDMTETNKKNALDGDVLSAATEFPSGRQVRKCEKNNNLGEGNGCDR